MAMNSKVECTVVFIYTLNVLLSVLPSVLPSVLSTGVERQAKEFSSSEWRILFRRELSLNWPNVLQRTSLLLGLVSLALAISLGMHIQHLLDDRGARHVGEVLVFVILTLLTFAGSWYGARQDTNSS
jgi:membrane-anchored glycerophosphoryl diester phosphodiesterase (GDPDase)